MSSPLVTPLHSEHVRLGARLVPFAGYEMPVQYEGVIAEARAVRQSAGVFDVSHMARLEFRGERALELLEWVTSNEVSKLRDGTGQYSLLPNGRGGVVDDVIVYRLTEKLFRMVVNASNHEKDLAHLREQNKFGVEILDVTSETAMPAVQGPSAVERLASICSDPDSLKSTPVFGTLETRFADVEAFAARSGYTGEDGFEIVVRSSDAIKLWQALLEVGVVPCGLGARDALRVEAGLPLYGHELSEDRSPLEAGLGWVISKTKRFLGSDEIAKVRASGPERTLLGVKMDGKRLPTVGAPVKVGGEVVGEVSSGVYSPLLERGVGFAFVRAGTSTGEECSVEIRGKDEPAKLVSKRFFKRTRGE